MPRALQMMTLANGGRRVPTYMHPDMFASRAVKANDGRAISNPIVQGMYSLAPWRIAVRANSTTREIEQDHRLRIEHV
jgi:hypothetical protein